MLGPSIWPGPRTLSSHHRLQSPTFGHLGVNLISPTVGFVPLSVKIDGSYVIFNSEKPETLSALNNNHVVNQQWLDCVMKGLQQTSTFQILTDLSEPLDPVTIRGDFSLTHVI